jgi:hypothetical protein
MTIPPVLVALVILLAAGLWLARWWKRRTPMYVSAAIARLYLAGVYLILIVHPMDIDTRASLLRFGLLALFATEIVANVTAMIAELVGIKHE